MCDNLFDIYHCGAKKYFFYIEFVFFCHTAFLIVIKGAARLFDIFFYQ